jgi:hypothetical protein
MSSLLDDILNYSTLHLDYLIEASRKNIFERYTWSELIINFLIPLLILFVFIFILKKRYIEKKVKIKIANNFKGKFRKKSENHT